MEKIRVKSRDIAQTIAAEVQEQRLPAGTPVLPVRALATRFGVSGVTADRALKKLEREGVVYRIPGRGTYVKQEPRKILRVGYAANVCDPRHVNPNSGMRGINLYAPHALAEFALHGYEPELISWRELQEPNLAARRLSGLDGLLVSRGHIDSDTLPQLRSFDGIIVCYEHEHRMIGCPWHQVYPDWRIGLLQAFSELHPERYARIVLIHACHSNALDRRQCIIDTLTEYGCNVSEELQIRNSPGDSGQLSAYRSFTPLVGKCRNALILSTSDYFSFGIVELLREHGLEPGRDLSLLSMDNIEFAGIHPYGQAFLTTVDGVMPDLSRESVRLLLSRMESDDDCVHEVIVPTRTAFRQSTMKNT